MTPRKVKSAAALSELRQTCYRRQVEILARHFVSSYQNDDDKGFWELVQFIFDVTGSKGEFTDDDLQDPHWTHIVKRMNKDYAYSNTTKYPMDNSIIRRNVGDFFRYFIRLCGSDVLYDGFLLPNLLQMLSALMESRVIVFRYTATLIVLKMLTESMALCLEMQQEQPEENGADLDESSQARNAHSVRQNVVKLKQFIKEMSNLVQKGFKDTDVSTQLLCLDEMLFWVENNLQFLGGSIFKCVSYCLRDPDASVRYNSLQVVEKLVDGVGERNLLIVQAVNRFLFAFHPLLRNLTLDKDLENAVCAFRVFALICRNIPDSLPPYLHEDLFLSVYSKIACVAYAAGAYVMNLVEVGAENNIQILSNLLRFSVKLIGGEHMLVDALTEAKANWMDDFDTMMNLLLDNESMELSDEQELTLVYIFCIQVRRMATKQRPPRTLYRGMLPAKENEKVRSGITPVVIRQAYPKLLEKFRLDYEKITSLLQIFPYLNFHLQASHETELVEPLLESFQNVFDVISETKVLTEISKCLRDYVRAVELELKVEISGTFSMFIYPTVISATGSLLEWFELSDDERMQSEEMQFDVLVKLKKVSELSAYHDTTKCDAVWIAIKKFLAEIAICVIPLELPEVLEHAAKAYLINLKRQSSELAVDHEQDAAKNLPKDIESFALILLQLLMGGHADYRPMVYPTLCGTLITLKRFGIPTVLAKRFVDESAKILKCEVFTKDSDGNYTHGTNEQRLRLFWSFAQTVKYGVVAVNETPCIYQHYNQYRNDFGKAFEFLLMSSKNLSEVKCMHALLLSLASAYFGPEPNINDLKAVAKGLSELFGKPKLTGTEEIACFFHEFCFLVCIRNNPDASETFKFVEVISAFESQMKALTLEQISYRLTASIGKASVFRQYSIGKDHVTEYIHALSPYLSVRSTHTSISQEVSQIRERVSLGRVSTGSSSRRIQSRANLYRERLTNMSSDQSEPAEQTRQPKNKKKKRSY